MIVAFTIVVIVAVLALSVAEERKRSAREMARKKYLGHVGGQYPGCPHLNGCDTPISCVGTGRCLDCA